MRALGFELQQEAVLETLTQDAHKTSEIEGERLDLGQVRSSVASRLGIEAGGLHQVEERVEGVVEMMMDATTNFERPLTRERLWGWQHALFPHGRSGLSRIIVGGWRDDRAGPMRVISGPLGRERVHFEAPAAGRIEEEIRVFLDWFNTPSDTDWVVKAGVAHLWFVTIHPFDDGNGRVARAITDMALARSERSSRRFYSMSSQIRIDRRDYYRSLERTQKGTTDITAWMGWFLGCLSRAIDGAESTLEAVLAKATFWRRIANVPLNDRQRRVLNRLLDGFEGNLTTSKWARLAKISQDTALRDITGLVNHGILVRGPAGGRSTSYRLDLSIFGD
jgi:Fic family protein